MGRINGDLMDFITVTFLPRVFFEETTHGHPLPGEVKEAIRQFILKQVLVEVAIQSLIGRVLIDSWSLHLWFGWWIVRSNRRKVEKFLARDRITVDRSSDQVHFHRNPRQFSDCRGFFFAFVYASVRLSVEPPLVK